MIHSGVTAEHSQFWKEQDVNTLYKLYCSMTCTAEKVLGHIVSVIDRTTHFTLLRAVCRKFKYQRLEYSPSIYNWLTGVY